MTIRSQYDEPRRDDLAASRTVTHDHLRAALELAGGLASSADLGRRWDRSKSVMSRLVNQSSFPRPIYDGRGRHRLWIVDECDAWWRQRR